MDEDRTLNSSQALWALLAILVVQAVTDVAVLLLGQREQGVLRALPYLVSGAAGVLLATASLDLLPEAVRLGRGNGLLWPIFLGSLLSLFLLQALTHKATAHTSAIAPPHVKREGQLPAGPLHDHGVGTAHSHVLPSLPGATTPLLLGSALHSAVDGLAIAAAFAAGSAAGCSAAIAVMLHEFPHRLSDYSLLLHKGVPQKRAAVLAIAAGATALLGGFAVLVLGHGAVAERWLLPVSAASFLYIALVDLLPEIQSRQRDSRMGWELVCLIGGAVLIAVAIHFPGE